VTICLPSMLRILMTLTGRISPLYSETNETNWEDNQQLPLFMIGSDLIVGEVSCRCGFNAGMVPHGFHQRIPYGWGIEQVAKGQRFMSAGAIKMLGNQRVSVRGRGKLISDLRGSLLARSVRSQHGGCGKITGPSGAECPARITHPVAAQGPCGFPRNCP
jgi:hypothetical protein